MTRVIFITKDNELIGIPIYTRYNALPRWKKILCFFSKNYKIRFIDIKGFEIANIVKNP